MGSFIRAAEEELEEPEEKPGRSLVPLIAVLVVVILAIVGVSLFFVLKGSFEAREEARQEAERAAEKKKNKKKAEAKPKTAEEEALPAEEAAPAAEEPVPAEEEEAPAEEEAAEEEEEESEAPHTYDYIVKDLTWDQAFAECREWGGHLVTFESDEEFRDVLEALNQKDLTGISFFVGGKRDAGSKEYRWVNEDGDYFGEAVNGGDYSGYWLENEPSFSDGDNEETRMDLIFRSKADTWYFNDIPNDILAVSDSFSGKIGYICEYE